MRGASASLRFETIQLDLRRTVLESVAAEAVQRTVGGDASPAALASERGEDKEHTEVVRLWFAAPDRWRSETVVGRAGDPIVQVVAGLDWWISNPLAPDERFRSGREQADNRVITEAPPFEPLWDLRPLDESRQRDRTGATVYLGRKCSTQVATPRSDPPADGVWPGATREELVVDEERDVILWWAAYLGARPYGLIEVTRVTYDEQLPEELFDRGQ